MKMFLGFLLGVVTSAGAATVILQPVANSEIREFSSISVIPVGSTFFSGQVGDGGGNETRRALLRFDLSSIPANATISSVTVTTVVSKAPLSGNRVNSNFQLRKVLQNWTEAGATWNSRQNITTPWQSPGASGVNDTVATPSASVLVGDVGTYVFTSTPTLVQDVQGWVVQPGSNFGWLLRSDTEADYTARQFHSRNSASSPRLVVTYEEPVVEPSEPTIANPQIVGNNLQFSFQAEAPFVYTVESRTSLATGNWETLTNFIAQATTTAVITDAVSGDARFYRVSVSAQ